MALEGKRVLIDASMTRAGGGFTHLVNLLPALSQRAPEARLHVLLRSRTLAEAIDWPPNAEPEMLPERGLVGRFAFLYGPARRHARRFGADVYLSVADYAPPRLDCPAVVCLRNPNVFTALDQGWGPYQTLRLGTLRRLASASARRAARVVFVSEDSARWIGDAARIPPERRRVVHHGIDVERWRARGAAGARVDRGILSVSTIYRYKNFVRLIEAYRMLAGSAAFRAHPGELPDLTIVGDDQDPWYSARMREARAAAGALAEKIHLVGAVSYDEIASYYFGSRISVFPSYLETFGHPLLEAMAAELPLVAADIPVFREIAGEAALYADPHDTAALAAAMGRLLADPALCERLRASGRERAADFSWGRAAERLAGVLAEVLDEPPAAGSPRG